MARRKAPATGELESTGAVYLVTSDFLLKSVLHQVEGDHQDETVKVKFSQEDENGNDP